MSGSARWSLPHLLATLDDQRPLIVHGSRVVVAIALAVVTYLLFPASPAVNFPVLEVGAVAPENVIAPFEFRVPRVDPLSPPLFTCRLLWIVPARI